MKNKNDNFSFRCSYYLHPKAIGDSSHVEKLNKTKYTDLANQYFRPKTKNFRKKRL
jgi:hypothetical protein